MTSPEKNRVKPIVFFDGGCPLCMSEIKHYQRLDIKKEINWIDIHQQPQKLKTHNIKFDEAQKRLHCLTSEDKKVTGVLAFLLIWDHLPYYRNLSKGVRNLRLIRPLEYLYSRFAKWRFKRRCDDACLPVRHD